MLISYNRFCPVAVCSLREYSPQCSSLEVVGVLFPFHFLFQEYSSGASTEWATISGYMSKLSGLVVSGTRVLVPRQECQRLLEFLHETHLGAGTILATVRRLWWWPGMSNNGRQV